MDSVLQDLRFGARALRKQPAFAALVSLTLGLAIGVNTLIFSFVNFFLLRPLPFKDMERLVYVSGTHPDTGNDRQRVSYADYLEWRASARSFEDMAAITTQSFNLTGAGEPQRVVGRPASASQFPVWGLGAEIGRTLVPADDRKGAERVALLSHGFWQRRFGGDRGVLGRALRLDGESYTVVGVVSRQIEIGNFSEIDVWVPLALHGDPNDRVRRDLSVTARLKPGIGLTAARAELGALAERQQQEHPATHAGWSARVVPLRSALTSANAWVVLALLSVCVSLVLAIACANVANLMLARGSARSRETAVRAALGASRGRLLRQLLTEGALLSVLGGALGLLLAQWGLAVIRSVTFEQFFQLVAIDRGVLVFSLGISLVTPLVFGLAPALQASRDDLVSSLRDGGSRALGQRAGGRMRRGLVVLQMTLAASLLIVAGLSLRSSYALQVLDPGYDIRGLLTFKITLPESAYDHDDETRAFVGQLAARLRGAPGEDSVAFGTGIPVLEDSRLSRCRSRGARPHARQISRSPPATW